MSVRLLADALGLAGGVRTEFEQAALGRGLEGLGFIYGRLGDHARATRWFGHALGLFRDFGDRYNEADALLNLGDVFAAMGDPAAATQSWCDAAQILHKLDHPREVEARQRLSG